MPKWQLRKRIFGLAVCIIFFFRMIFHGNGSGKIHTFQLGDWFIGSVKSTADGLSAEYSYSGLAVLAVLLTAQAAWRLYRYSANHKK